MQPKLLRMAGLARRAGKLACGTEAVRDAAGRAGLILLASDAGNTAGRDAERYGKPLMILPYDKEELGRAVGRKTCAIAAVTDDAFCRGIIEAMEEFE
ncbi:MAG: hypothetical protein FWG72_07815 [Oscillospiraceae bacterium]|nr:hypothetical protein [Oscillospiraceae bacterium]